MKKHKASRHGIVAEVKDDGKERNMWGAIVETCGIDGCSYKTGNTGHMKRHKGAKHGVEQVWKNDGKVRECMRG